LVGSGVGSIVLVGGALWSAWTFFRKRHNGRRAVANVIIAIGVFIVAAGGTATFTGASGVLELANLLGLSVMFVGFLLVG
jgi:drug/metabolite transporter (DMT)-like permease